MHGSPRCRQWTRAGVVALLLHVSLIGASAEQARRRLAEETEVVLTVPRGRPPYVSTAPTKFVQADFGTPLSSQLQPLQLVEITGAARWGASVPPPLCQLQP